MEPTSKQTKTGARLCTLVAAMLMAGQAGAREPGVRCPCACQRDCRQQPTGFPFQNFYDTNGIKTPTEITIRDTVLQ